MVVEERSHLARSSNRYNAGLLRSTRKLGIPQNFASSQGLPSDVSADSVHVWWAGPCIYSGIPICLGSPRVPEED